MARLGRYAGLLSIDASDTLRPPGFDVMTLLLAMLGGVLAVLQPITDPAGVATSVLDPTLFAVAIFLAMRAAAGISGLAENGVLQVYLAYPVSRLGVGAVLWVSRVLIPAASLLAIPAATASLILYPVVSQAPGRLLAVYAAYLVQALLYGTVFSLIAVKTRSPATSGLFSIAFYFTYTVSAFILVVVSTNLGVPWLSRAGVSLLYYRVVLEALGGAEVAAWQLAAVPAGLAAALAALLLYFHRRFEA